MFGFSDETRKVSDLCMHNDICIDTILEMNTKNIKLNFTSDSVLMIN
jgi:hypothetical protein